MPTNRRRSLRSNNGPLTPTQNAWLCAEPLDKVKHVALEYMLLDRPTPFTVDATGVATRDNSAPSEGRDLWKTFGSEIVEEHVAEWPGTRPERWWQFSAPEPRQRQGGTGTAAAGVLAYAPRFYLGVPLDWIVADDLALYERLGTPLHVPAVDLKDAPTFESEAAFLRRLKLFLPGEARRLFRDDFEPVSLLDIIDFEDVPA